MKIVVTGANGFLGRGIIKQLLDDGKEVIAVDFTCDGVDERAQKIENDLFSIDNPYNFFGKPDCLLHLAWKNGFKHDAVSHLEDLQYHYKFIEKMITSGLKKVSILGSMHEIGFYEGSINENTPANPQNLYGISKNALRIAVELLAKKNNVIYQWIRGFYIVSNSSVGSSIFSKIVQTLESGNNEFPFTSGKNQYDFLDYKEFCLQVSAIIEQSQINGIINCCHGSPEKLSDRVEQFIKENNFNIKLKYGAYPDRPYDSKAVWGDNSKIMKILESRNLADGKD